MFADQLHTEESGTLASVLTTLGWALVGVLVLVAVWKMFNRYGLPNFEGLADRFRGALVMRSSTTPEEKGGVPAAPATQTDDTAAAPPTATAQNPAAKGAAPATAPVQHPADEDEAPAWLPKVLVSIASVPTLLALPWAAYSVAKIFPIPLTVALSLGVLFDVAMVSAVLVALLVPSVSRQASFLGWVAASGAAVAISVHVGFSGALVFAATPLISKALWGLLITIRKQETQRRAERAAAEAEEKAAQEAKEAEETAELSDELTFEQQRQIADKRREARFKLDMAAAERELERAESEAEHQKALAEIKRLGEQQREEDREAAAVFEQRLRLERQLATLSGKAPSFLAVSSGDQGPEVSGEITAKAGFGGATPTAFGFQRPLDVKALTPEGAEVKFEDLPEHYQELVKYVHTAKEPSMREAGRKLDRDQRTIGRWVDRLEGYGYECPFERKK
jgi:hypothetical protein